MKKKEKSDSENKQTRSQIWERINVHGQGDKGVTEDGIRIYLATDGRVHFYKDKEWICCDDSIHTGLALARWTVRNKENEIQKRIIASSRNRVLRVALDRLY